MEIDIREILVFLVVGVSAYFLASAITGFKFSDTIRDTSIFVLESSANFAAKKQSENTAEFGLLSAKKKQNSKRYKYHKFIDELMLDSGWRSKGITAEIFTIFNLLVSVALAAIMYPIMGNLFLVALLCLVFFVLDIAIIFSISRYGARQRIRKLIAAENLICGNISMGVEDAVAQNMDLFDSSIRPVFQTFIDRITLQGFSLARGLAMLSEELGDHSDPLCKRLYIYETDKKPGSENMFRFIMLSNIREEERAAERDFYFGEMNVNFFVCSGILIVFLLGCIGSMPAVVTVYASMFGKFILVLFFCLLAGCFIFIQIMQSKRFVYLPEKL